MWGDSTLCSGGRRAGMAARARRRSVRGMLCGLWRAAAAVALLALLRAGGGAAVVVHSPSELVQAWAGGEAVIEIAAVRGTVWVLNTTLPPAVAPVHLRGGGVVLDGAREHGCLAVPGLPDVRIEDVTLLDCAGAGVLATGTRNLTLVGVAVHNSTGAGVHVTGERAVLRDLHVAGCGGDGVVLSGAAHELHTSRVGTTADGLAAWGNARHGVQAGGCRFCVVADSLVSGNGPDAQALETVFGLVLTGNGSLALRNRIGTDATGMYAVPNPSGVFCAEGCQLQHNLISGKTGGGA